MRILSALQLLALTIALQAQSPARTGRDYAVFFVAAKFDNGWAALPDAAGEVNQLAGDLRESYGFDVKIVADAKRADILRVLGEYKRKTYGPDDQLFLYFSMHGYHDKNSDAGYLIPKDGLYDEVTYDSWLAHSTLQELLVSMPCKRILVGLDACYSGIFGRGRDKPTAADWEEGTDCASKLKAAFSAGAARKYTAAGGDERVPAKSAFAELWHKALQRGYGDDDLLSFAELSAVLDQYRNPRPVFGDFARTALGDFVFVRKNACATQPDRDGDGVPDAADACPDTWGSQANGCSPDPSNNDDMAADLEAWRGAKRTGTEASYRDYLRRFPNGEFKEPANQALRDIETKAANRRDNTAWDIAEEKNTLEAYQKYRSDYPKGLHAAAAADKIKTLETPAEANDGLVLVRGGTFDMGCTSEQQDCGDYEKPAHRVTVNDFYIGRYEVTQKLWREVMGTSPSNFKNCDECPVEKVSWTDVQEFLQKLNARSPGRNYRLPTEAEWEYAARGGGKAVLFGNGKNTADPKEINFNTNAAYQKSYSLTGEYRQKTVPVGSLQSPNALGLHDMSGNVYEWCEDWYHDSYKGAPTDGSAWLSPAGSSRVIRGGSWGDYPQGCRVAYRSNYTPGYRSYYVGFRLARTK